MKQCNKGIIAAIIIALGLFLLGNRIQIGLQTGLSDERCVSVCGLSERLVPADKEYTPYIKNVRVVTSVIYYLKD